jgi:hypothetical protein
MVYDEDEHERKAHELGDCMKIIWLAVAAAAALIVAVASYVLL